jgi:hypothetical protein
MTTKPSERRKILAMFLGGPGEPTRIIYAPDPPAPPPSDDAELWRVARLLMEALLRRAAACPETLRAPPF